MNVSEVMQQSDLLEFAGNMIERHDFQDQAPSLLEICGVAQHGMPTPSGLNDYDYQSLTSLSMGMKNLNQVVTVNRVPIPNEIMEHFKHIKCHCMMGLFPEIGRAWLTIDSDIYIWTYEQSRDVAYFDGLSDLIISVGLVSPKPGVFISEVKHLLVLTTPVEIVVLGVTFGESNKTAVTSPTRNLGTADEMQLLNKPIFVLNTDNVPINVVEGTRDGRIFLGGRDGCLYEIAYQAESNWFGKRSKKINHSQGIVSYMVPGFLKIFSEVDPIKKIVVDDSRHLLYVLTEKGAVEAWDLGADVNETRRIARVSQHDIANSASKILKTVEVAVFKPVAALCPLSAEDCPNLHLLAVSHTGVRFYFSLTPLILGQQQHLQTVEQQRPQGLYLLHVRLPPGYTPNTTMGKPKQVHSAFYKNGSLLMISTPAQDQDLLWSISSEPFPFRPFLAESSTVMPLDGQVWALGELKNRSNALETPIKQAQNPRKLVILTNQGAHIVALLKPVDILHQLLVACHGAHHEAIKAYFQVQSEPQACATSLALACMDQIRNTEVVQWAIQAFLLYGGEPHFGVSPMQNMRQSIGGGGGGPMNPSHTFMDAQHTMGPVGSPPRIYMSTPLTTSRPASQVQQSLMQQTQFQASPINPNMMGQGQGHQPYNVSMQQVEQTNLNYSAKHAGLYLHVTRLLRPIWRRRCIDFKLASTITQQDCTELLSDLYAIKALLDPNSGVSHLSNLIKMNVPQNHISVINSPAHYSAFGHQPLVNGAQKKSAEEAHTEEKKSLDALTRFIRHAAEVIALWKILCEHQFHILISQLTKEQQNILGACTFRDLILIRTDICAQLIVTLINTYLSDSANVTSISSKLRDVCPTLYRQEDAVSHKATEILMLSKNCTDNDEKEERLRTALHLCKSAAPKLPLSSICQQFTLAGFYQGVIDLCATCAAKIDPKDIASSYYRSNEPNQDQEGYIIYNTRREYYKELKDMFETVYQNLLNANMTMDMTRGIPMDEDRERNINSQILRIVGLTLQSDDNLLHNAVYEWLLNKDLLSELLGISQPSLGEFLQRSASAARSIEDPRIADLLWKYYERNGQHDKAARILDTLASCETEQINLEQRIEYLARAIMCMRSDAVGCSAHNGILLKELEDKLEIARVQKQILDAISTFAATATNNTKDAMRSLNSSLYNMTHLYSDFCEDFDLWECKLTILNCSHHNDPLLVESIWIKILEKEIQVPGTDTEKIRHLLTKVQSIGVEFSYGGHCFPLLFIVRELEVRCFKLRVIDSPVPEALLLDMKLDVDCLLDIYASMISMNERVWATENDELYLIRSTTILLSIISSQQNLVHPKNRRRMVAKSQDLISACRNLVYTKPNTEQIIDKLKEIEAKLQRVY